MTTAALAASHRRSTMPDKYRRKPISDVDAAQFTGGEENAAAVIAWGSTMPQAPTIERYTAERFDLPADRRHPELWLVVTAWGYREYASPGCWIIVDAANHDIEILSDAQFHEDYEIAEATA